MSEVKSLGELLDVPAIPTMVSGLRVVSAIKVTTGPDEWRHQWVVVCQDHDRTCRDKSFVVWKVGFDDRTGRYEAFNGNYGLSFDAATRKMIDRATTMSEIMTLADTVSAAAILDAAQHCRTVARLIDGVVFWGTARSVGDDLGHFARGDSDVRECSLRVTLSGGSDTFWKVRDLMADYERGEFFPNYQP